MKISCNAVSRFDDLTGMLGKFGSQVVICERDGLASIHRPSPLLLPSAVAALRDRLVAALTLQSKEKLPL